MGVYITRDIGKIDGIIDGIILEDVIQMVNADKDREEINVWIRTRGGDVQEAKDIYNYLKSLNKTIVTHADGNVDSAGVILLLAGDQRIGYKDLSTSLIHSTMPVLQSGVYKSDELITAGQDSQSLTDEMVKFYSDITGQTKEAFAPLVRDETELSVDQMKSLGFITEIQEKPIRAVAFKSKKADNKMSKEIEELQKETQKEFKSMGAKFDALMKKLGIKSADANIIIQDANGTEIDFFEREEGQPEIGDKANVDGSPAAGEHTMKDGSVYTFEAGVLTSIAPEENEEDEDMAAALKEENETLKAEMETLKAANAKFEKEAQETAQTVKELKTSFANLQSNFNLNMKDEGKKKSGDDESDETKKRSLFKS